MSVFQVSVQNTNLLICSRKGELKAFVKIPLPSIFVFVLICSISLKISQLCCSRQSSLWKQLKIFSSMKPGHLPYFNNLSVLPVKQMLLSQSCRNFTLPSHFCYLESALKNNTLHLHATSFSKRVGRDPWKGNSAQHLEAAEPALPCLLPRLESAVHPADSDLPRFQRKIQLKKC